MKTGLFTGTFDPFTIGHQNIVDRALPLFDRLIIAVAESELKHTSRTIDERVTAIRQLYAHGSVNDHFSRIDDRRSLLSLKHDCRNLRSICQISDTRFDDRKACFLHSALDLFFNSCRNHFAGTAKASFIRDTVSCGIYIRRYIVRIQPHNITERTIALQRKVFLIVVYIKNCFCRVHHPPR